MGERGVRNAEVRGSIPLISTRIFYKRVPYSSQKPTDKKAISLHNDYKLN